MSWKLGTFIQNVLEERGGKRAGWHQLRLAQLSGLSATQIGWIVNGETSNKKGPPSLMVDTIISLARALGMKEQILIDAYKGLEPNASNEDQAESKRILMDVVKQIPSKLLLESLTDDEIFRTLLALKGEEKMRQLMQEMLRRREQQQ